MRHINCFIAYVYDQTSDDIETVCKIFNDIENKFQLHEPIIATFQIEK